MTNPFQQVIYEEELNEGRPSQRHPLEGHDYHRKSDDQLRYIVKDAGEAAKALKGTRSEGKYLDQVNDASTVLHFRKSGMPDWYKKKYGHMNEEVELEEAKVGDTVSFHHELKSAPGSKVKKSGTVEKVDGDVVHVKVKDKYGVKRHQIKMGDLVKEEVELDKSTQKLTTEGNKEQGVAEGKFVKAAGGVPSDRHGNPLPSKPPKSVSTMSLKQLEKNKRENPGQSPFKTQDKKVKKYLGLEEEGVAEGVDLDEAVSIEHDRYMRSHGKKASGTGTWMFTHKRAGDVDYKNDKEVHQARGSFSDAAKSAKAWAKSHGHSTVYVMEEVEIAENQVWKGHSSTVKNPNFNDELSIRRVNPVGKRLKSGKLSADEKGSQERLKSLIKFKREKGGLTGPQGTLPEEVELEEASDTKRPPNFTMHPIDRQDYKILKDPKKKPLPKASKEWGRDGGEKKMKEEVELDEKTLTPAELKKREEVAKAMERDKPGMPMAKKMAIATAVAKRVAEQNEDTE